jgi:DNA-binding transcriptional ArsR family regulator
VTHPAQRLDNVVHQRARLGVLTVLTGAKRADFTFLRDTLGLTDGNLSRNLTVLENAGYIAVEKQFNGRRPRTWIAITPVGRPRDRRPARNCGGRRAGPGHPPDLSSSTRRLLTLEGTSRTTHIRSRGWR